ncbi:MAG: hypothetical protein LQ340_004332 [Diploschistes diacapsis]|nr:MAG: hypothetical protein LQ340_004332 [Diploschistes diacapsis]
MLRRHLSESQGSEAAKAPTLTVDPSLADPFENTLSRPSRGDTDIQRPTGHEEYMEEKAVTNGATQITSGAGSPKMAAHTPPVTAIIQQPSLRQQFQQQPLRPSAPQASRSYHSSNFHGSITPSWTESDQQRQTTIHDPGLAPPPRYGQVQPPGGAFSPKHSPARSPYNSQSLANPFGNFRQPSIPMNNDRSAGGSLFAPVFVPNNGRFNEGQQVHPSRPQGQGLSCHTVTAPHSSGIARTHHSGNMAFCETNPQPSVQKMDEQRKKNHKKARHRTSAQKTASKNRKKEREALEQETAAIYGTPQQETPLPAPVCETPTPQLEAPLQVPAQQMIAPQQESPLELYKRGQRPAPRYVPPHRQRTLQSPITAPQAPFQKLHSPQRPIYSQQPDSPQENLALQQPSPQQVPLPISPDRQFSIQEEPEEEQREPFDATPIHQKKNRRRTRAQVKASRRRQVEAAAAAAQTEASVETVLQEAEALHVGGDSPNESVPEESEADQWDESTDNSQDFDAPQEVGRPEETDGPGETDIRCEESLREADIAQDGGSQENRSCGHDPQNAEFHHTIFQDESLSEDTPQEVSFNKPSPAEDPERETTDGESITGDAFDEAFQDAIDALNDDALFGQSPSEPATLPDDTNQRGEHMDDEQMLQHLMQEHELDEGILADEPNVTNNDVVDEEYPSLPEPDEEEQTALRTPRHSRENSISNSPPVVDEQEKMKEHKKRRARARIAEMRQAHERLIETMRAAWPQQDQQRAEADERLARRLQEAEYRAGLEANSHSQQIEQILPRAKRTGRRRPVNFDINDLEEDLLPWSGRRPLPSPEVEPLRPDDSWSAHEDDVDLEDEFASRRRYWLESPAQSGPLLPMTEDPLGPGESQSSQRYIYEWQTDDCNPASPQEVVGLGGEIVFDEDGTPLGDDDDLFEGKADSTRPEPSREAIDEIPVDKEASLVGDSATRQEQQLGQPEPTSEAAAFPTTTQVQLRGHQTLPRIPPSGGLQASRWASLPISRQPIPQTTRPAQPTSDNLLSEETTSTPATDRLGPQHATPRVRLGVSRWATQSGDLSRLAPNWGLSSRSSTTSTTGQITERSTFSVPNSLLSQGLSESKTSQTPGEFDFAAASSTIYATQPGSPVSRPMPSRLHELYSREPSAREMVEARISDHGWLSTTFGTHSGLTSDNVSDESQAMAAEPESTISVNEFEFASSLPPPTQPLPASDIDDDRLVQQSVPLMENVMIFSNLNDPLLSVLKRPFASMSQTAEPATAVDLPPLYILEEQSSIPNASAQIQMDSEKRVKSHRKYPLAVYERLFLMVKHRCRVVKTASLSVLPWYNIDTEVKLVKVASWTLSDRYEQHRMLHGLLTPPEPSRLITSWMPFVPLTTLWLDTLAGETVSTIHELIMPNSPLESADILHGPITLTGLASQSNAAPPIGIAIQVDTGTHTVPSPRISDGVQTDSRTQANVAIQTNAANPSGILVQAIIDIPPSSAVPQGAALSRSPVIELAGNDPSLNNPVPSPANLSFSPIIPMAEIIPNSVVEDDEEEFFDACEQQKTEDDIPSQHVDASAPIGDKGEEASLARANNQARKVPIDSANNTWKHQALEGLHCLGQFALTVLCMFLVMLLFQIAALEETWAQKIYLAGYCYGELILGLVCIPLWPLIQPLVTVMDHFEFDTP